MINFFSKNAVIFSTKSCIAALIAFYVALALNFDKPAWSLTSVYVVSQYYSASTISKSIYRFLGTLLGGIFIFLIYPLTVYSPVLFSLSVSLWVAFCLYFSLINRKPSNYIFMLGGYSAAIIGFPDVYTPQAITWTVISRIEEITVAIICSGLIHSLILPVSMRKKLESSLNGWLEKIHDLCLNILENTDEKTLLNGYAVLIKNPSTIENIIAHCEFDGVMSKGEIQTEYERVRNLSLYLPVVAAFHKRLEKLNSRQVQLPAYIQRLLSQFNDWLNAQDRKVPYLNHALNMAKDENKKSIQRGDVSLETWLLVRGLCERIEDILDLTVITESFNHISRSDRLSVSKSPSSRKQWHIDHGLLNLSCLTAFVATFTTCLFWAGNGWKDGASAPMIAAIICSFYATLDKPTVLMKTFMKGTLIAAATSVAYITLIMPMAINIESLYLSLIPLLVFLGLVIARPSTNLIGIVITAQIPAFIAMSHHFRPDVLMVVNQGISMVVGIFFATVITSIIRNKSPQWTAKRAYRKGIYDLFRLLERIRLNQVSDSEIELFWRKSLDKSSVIFPRLTDDNKNYLEYILIDEVWIAENIYRLSSERVSNLEKNGIHTDRLIELLKNYLVSTTSKKRGKEREVLLSYLNGSIIALEAMIKVHGEPCDALFYIHSIRMAIYPDERWPAEMT